VGEFKGMGAWLSQNQTGHAPRPGVLTPEQRAQKSRIIAEVHAEWAAEQVGKFQPDSEYGQTEPSQYPEHADLISSSPEAEQDLLDRTRAALIAAGLLADRG
jgi:hypothetical protein